MSIKGNSLSTLQEISGSPEVEITARGRAVLRKYACQYSLVESLIPPIGTPDSGFSDMLFVRAAYVRDGDAAMLTLRYEPADVEQPLTPDGSDKVLRVSANAIEIPIEQHPDYSPSWASSKAGVTSYLSPQPTVTRTVRRTNFVYSESNVVYNVGKRVAPPNISGATVANWLKTARDCGDVGVSATGQRITEITDSYQYAENGWDTDIYPLTGVDT